MHQTSRLLKISAVCSALLLAAGFICHRAGVFHAYFANTGSPSMSAGQTANEMATTLTLMHGSKAIDTPGLVPEVLCTPPAIPSVIDQLPCDEFPVKPTGPK